MFNETGITDDIGLSNTRLHVTPSSFFTNIYSQQTEDPVGGVDYRLRGSNVWFDNDLAVGMTFESKQETINAIKQYHIKNSFNYLVEESRPDRYVAKCVMFGDGCQWQIRASYNMRCGKWQIKKISGIHTCTTSSISQDHTKLDSDVIADSVVGLVSADPGIPVKALIEEVRNQFHYIITYKKGWKAKQKAMAKVFGDWEESYTVLPRWMNAVQNSIPGTIVKYELTPYIVDGVEDPENMVLKRVFWAFKPCIDGFPYCKPIVQVDGTFLTGKYRGTLLVAIAQDGTRTILPIAYAIVEGETKEAWAWFLYNLRMFVTPQPNLCIMSDRGKGLLAALKSEQVGWAGSNVQSVYCIRHIASNFNKKFQNSDLKKYVISMGYEMQQPRFEVKLLAMRSEFRQAAEWLDKIPIEKWTQSYDGGKRYGHMTTNLAKCLNSNLKGARALPITALVKTTFYRLTSLFVDEGVKALSMMNAGHIYCEELSTTLLSNRRLASSHRVRSYTRASSEFEVEEMTNPLIGRRAMTCKVNLNNWWCDCGEFQALRYPCSHVIASCAYCNVDCQVYIDPIYRLENIFKVYQHEFHPLGDEEYWPPYTGSTLNPDPLMRRDTMGRPRTSRIHNEMDAKVPNQKKKKCGYCRTEGHNRSKCPCKETNA